MHLPTLRPPSPILMPLWPTEELDFLDESLSSSELAGHSSQTVAQYIQEHPECLVGQLREVTLMFADLCGFASLTELLSPSECTDLSASVMELLTEIVVAKHGVVIDYFGDGLLALWNAPLEQAEHAALACAAAQEMLDCLPEAGQGWCKSLCGPLQLGIGLHTGTALVGNTGARSRVKYGPRGHAVNIASRVQAACQQFDLSLVITGATYERLSGEFCGLRICQATLHGLEQKLDLYTVYPPGKESELREDFRRYAEALDWFEAGNLVTAERLLADLSTRGGATPAQFLAHHTADQLRAARGRRLSDRVNFSEESVIELAGK